MCERSFLFQIVHTYNSTSKVHATTILAEIVYVPSTVSLHALGFVIQWTLWDPRLLYSVYFVWLISRAKFWRNTINGLILAYFDFFLETCSHILFSAICSKAYFVLYRNTIVLETTVQADVSDLARCQSRCADSSACVAIQFLDDTCELVTDGVQPWYASDGSLYYRYEMTCKWSEKGKFHG